jgi:arsenite methyltransferase
VSGDKRHVRFHNLEAPADSGGSIPLNPILGWHYGCDISLSITAKESIVQYTGDIATIQQQLAETSDLYRRRLAVLDAVDPQPGERVLEIGCGGGALLPAVASAVGPSGRVVGIDISQDQIAAAARRCSGQQNIELAVLDARRLPYEPGSFDAFVAIQVIEYLDDPLQALTEMRRVATDRARAAILATNWDSVFWNTPTEELTRKIQRAWRQHAPHPNLPAELRPLLRRAGFQVIRLAPVTIMNASYHEDSFAYWVARLIVAFCVGRGLVTNEEADAWLVSLSAAQAADTFFFSSTPVVTVAAAVTS